MTVVAWDGKTLAVDRLGDANGQRVEIVKGRISVEHQCVFAWTGGVAEGLALADWYEKGRLQHSPYPEFQNSSDRWCRLIVADGSGVVYFEQAPIEIPVLEKFAAWGSGRDYALGAMAMGATAQQAVEVTNRLAIHCGIGVDVFYLAELIKL